MTSNDTESDISPDITEYLEFCAFIDKTKNNWRYSANRKHGYSKLGVQYSFFTNKYSY